MKQPSMADDSSVHSGSNNKNITAYKITISIIFGLLGFAINFYPVDFVFYGSYRMSFLLGLLFPMLITLAWGWKYGLLSALCGGCQTMWILWVPQSGYGPFVSVPPFTLWIVWLGWFSRTRRNIYLGEIIFRLFNTALLYTVFRWVFTLNVPPANVVMPLAVTHSIVFKEAVNGLFILFLAQALLYSNTVRRFFKLPKDTADPRRLEHLNAVLRAIRNLNQLITREGDRDRLLQGACENLIKTRGYHNVWIALLDESGGLLTSAEAGLGEEFLALVEQLERGELPARAREALAQPGVVVIKDPQSTCTDCPLAEGCDGRDAMTVRLEYGGKVYGLLDISVLSHLAIGEEEQALCKEVAEDISSALHRIELKEKRKRAEEALRRNLEERLVTEEALRRRNRELALLHRAGLTFSSSLNPDRVLATVLEEVRRLLSVTACSVWLTDSETGELVCQQAIGPHSEIVRGWHLAPGEGLAGWVAQNWESLIVPDTRANRRHFKDIDRQTGLEMRSLLSVPLWVKEAVIGVLQVMDTAPDRFKATDVALVESLTASAAIAIENARLYEQMQQELAERKRAEAERERLLVSEREQRTLAETLAGVTLSLTSHISYEAVLDEILQQAQRIVPYSTAHIMLLENGILRIARWHGYKAFGSESEEHVSNLVQSLADLPLDVEVVESRTPLVIPATHQDPRWVVFDKTSWVKSHLSAPICLRDRVLGLLRLDGDTPGEFSTEDAQRLQPLVNAAAIAIQNADLYEQVQRHAAELEQRVAERTRELEEANARLQELDRLKSKFVTDVSHELRTPISNIGMYLYLLERGKSEKHAQYLTVLKEQTDRLASLIEDIMNLSRLDLGREKVEFAPVDLNALVEQVVTAHLPRAEFASVELIFESDAALPPVRAERNQLAQVVTNLVTNAINYTADGQVRVSTYLDIERRQACLEIQDTGMGIETEDMSHLFERFYRGRRVGSSNIAGTGLGLAIVKEIVDLHGGAIKVESHLGEGSTFKVWLPLQEITA